MTTSLKLTERFEVRGRWFLPGQPENQVSGTLTFLPEDGGWLELEGAFDDLRQAAAGPPRAHPVILGRTRDYENVTLYKCLRTNVRWRFPPGAAAFSKYYAHVIFLGAHFGDPQDITFDEFDTRYAYLDEWLSLNTKDIQPGREQTTISVRHPGAIPILTTADYKVEVRFRGRVEPSRTETRITQFAYISVNATRPRHFQDYLEIMYYLQNFFALGVGDRVYPLEVGGVRGRDRVSVLYSFPWLPSVLREIAPHDMVFTYPDVIGRVPALIGQWVTRGEALRSVYQLYFGNLYHPTMYIEQRFLSLVQAVESYHRLARPGYELAPERHKERIAQILASAPEMHRKWLERKLEHSNEVILKVRVQQLMDEAGDLFQPPRRDEFVDKVVSTRHYMTHFSPHLKDRVASDDELFGIVQKLQFLLTVFLLLEAGFSRGDVQAFVDRNWRLGQDARSAWWE